MQESAIYTNKFTVNGGGPTSLDNGNITTDGVNGQLNVANLAVSQQTGTVTTLSNGNTITPGQLGAVRVTAGGAVTGLILAAGTRAGQRVVVIHEGAAGNTLTFAASGTSNVADGTSDVITGPSAREFIWDSVTALWYALH